MPAITFFKPTTRPKNPKQRYGIMPKIQMGPATLGVITIVIIFLMSLLYLAQANSTATKGYEIEREQEKIDKLNSQSEKLELEMAQLRSTKQLDNLPQQLNLKPLEGQVGSVQVTNPGTVAGAPDIEKGRP